jgi:hypothetical protein
MEVLYLCYKIASKLNRKTKLIKGKPQQNARHINALQKYMKTGASKDVRCQ